MGPGSSAGERMKYEHIAARAPRLKRRSYGKSQPTFGEAGDTAVCSRQWKTPERVNVMKKLCPCGRTHRRYGKAVGKVVCNEQCKTPEMADLVSKRCLCEKSRPTSEEAGDKVVCCKQCKMPELINVMKKWCLSTKRIADMAKQVVQLCAASIARHQ